MFSMEDRRRAVDLYFTEGMTIRKVIAELGYPSEGALVKWVREDPRYTGACRRSYTLECKTNAARRALFCFNVCSTGSAVFFRSVG